MDVCNIIDKELAKVLMPHRQEISNKGTHGTVLNFCGCRTYVGAAYLSAVASLRVGAGISELAAPNYVKDRVASISPDLVYTDTESYAYHEVIPKNIDLSKYSVILVGCGLGNNKYTQKFMRKFCFRFGLNPFPALRGNGFLICQIPYVKLFYLTLYRISPYVGKGHSSFGTIVSSSSMSDLSSFMELKTSFL